MRWILKFLKEVKFRSIIRAIRFSRQPILICGCGRSGTSLLLAILDAHPDIKGIDYETNIFVWKRYFKSDWINGIVHRLRIFNQLIRDEIKPTAKRWCEKTPKNVNYIPLILKELHQHVKIIHIIRDGRDVCTSYHPTTSGYHVSVDRWVNDVLDGLAFADHPKVLTIRYENLVKNFDHTLNIILDFLGEPYIKDLVDFHEKSTIVNHSAWFDKIRPLDTSSVARWKDEKHRERIQEFYQHEAAMNLMEQLDYK